MISYLSYFIHFKNNKCLYLDYENLSKGEYNRLAPFKLPNLVNKSHNFTPFHINISTTFNSINIKFEMTL